MAANDAAKAMIVSWLRNCPPDEQPFMFQIIDSYRFHFPLRRTVPDADAFDFPGEYVDFAQRFAAYMQSCPMGEVVEEFDSFEPLRLPGEKLNIIHTNQPSPPFVPDPFFPTISRAVDLPNLDLIGPWATQGRGFDLLGSSPVPPNAAPPVSNTNVRDDDVSMADQDDVGGDDDLGGDDDNQAPAVQQPALPASPPSPTNVRDHTWQEHVSDLEHAVRIMDEYESTNNLDEAELENTEDLDDILHDATKAKPYVREIYEAIVDFSDIIDKPVTERSGKRTQTEGGGVEDGPVTRDNAQVARVRRAPSFILEALSWIILEATVLAQRGIIFTSPWQNLSPYDTYKRYPDLRTRLNHVVATLRASKATVDNIMISSRLRNLVAVPERMLRRKMANKRTNETRGEQVRAGQEVIKKNRGASQAPNASEEPEAGEEYEDAE